MKKTFLLTGILTVLITVAALLYQTLSPEAGVRDELVYYTSPSAVSLSLPSPDTASAAPSFTGAVSPTASPVPLSTGSPLPSATSVPTAVPTPVPTPFPTPSPSPRPALSEPDFTVYTADGTAHRLSEFVGKPIVLNFWASWCTPCRDEMQYFQAAYADYSSRISFIMVSLDTDRSDAEDFVRKGGFTFPWYLDSTASASSAWGISAIPQTYFFSADGQLVAGKAGSISRSALLEGISRIL